jgi:hypothetical protein
MEEPMRNAWKNIAVLALALLVGGPAWAGVPRVVLVEDFTNHW